MATMLENRTLEEIAAAKEAERHNALIKERYQRLQNAESEQFAESTQESNATDYAVRASVLAPEAPVYTPVNEPTTAQQPQVTEFVRVKTESPVFTTEKFNSIAEATVEETIAPTAVQAPTTSVAFSTEAQYSLSGLAKAVLATFAAVVIVMLTLICVNTQIIRQKTVRLQNLEEKRQDLLEANEELQRRIENARSEETIREYAESQGMIQVNG